MSTKLEELDRDNIDLPTFPRFAEKHQALLYLAFEMQTRFHAHVLGTNFWQILIENRVRMFDDRYVSVTDILARYEERADLHQLPNQRNNHTDEFDNSSANHYRSATPLSPPSSSRCIHISSLLQQIPRLLI